MTSLTPADVREMTVRDEGDLARLWTGLLGDDGFDRRSLWMVFLSADDRVLPLVVPIDDIPPAPTQRDVDSLRTILTGLVGQHDVASVALLLSRPGSGGVTAQDRRWAQQLTELSPRWPICLATIGSVQVLQLDDLLG